MNADETMDQLRLFVSLRALSEGNQDLEALRTVEAELARLERDLAAYGEPGECVEPARGGPVESVEPTRGESVEPFHLAQEDLDNLFLLKMRQSLEAEGKIHRLAPLRWLYGFFRRFVLNTQRRYNESATFLVRRLYSTTLLTRYYQLRALALERRMKEIEAQLARLESQANRPGACPASSPSESRP